MSEKQLGGAPPIGLVVSILVLASATSIMSTDMYAPSLPDLADEFNTSASKIKLTISLNMVAFGLAQLLHGPLSDRFGRRPILLGSLVGVVIGCLLCTSAQTVNQLILARIFLGLVAAAEAVIGLAILKDLYAAKQQVKALALLGMVIAIVPAIAPILGGYLHVHFGWESNFYVIALMACVSLVVVYLFLPESSTPDPQALQIKRIASAYAGLLQNADFLSHTLVLGVALGLIFVFVTAAPFVLITYFGVQVQHFGYYQAAIVVSFFIGSVTASQLADYWAPERLLNFGVSFVMAGTVVLVLLIFIEKLSAINLAATYAIITFGMGPLFAVAPSHALRTIQSQAGAASAMLSGLEQGIAGLSAVAVSLIHDGTPKPMAWVSGLLALVLVGLVRWIAVQKNNQ
jgi:DHA1 family bicyclomycin/chloramphenicol resistance-like MFS transporter